MQIALQIVRKGALCEPPVAGDQVVGPSGVKSESVSALGETAVEVETEVLAEPVNNSSIETVFETSVDIDTMQKDLPPDQNQQLTDQPIDSKVSKKSYIPYFSDNALPSLRYSLYHSALTSLRYSIFLLKSFSLSEKNGI